MSRRMPDEHRKIAVNSRGKPAPAGAELILILLKVPLSDALSLQMEQVGDPNELSW